MHDQDNNPVNHAGWNGNPANPAAPWNTPTAVGTSATRYSQRWRVSAALSRP
jgi:hypothetical protein